MTTQLKALFEDRDGADLALMRLRRNGVDYSIADLRAPERGLPRELMMTDLAFGPTATDAVSPGQMVSAVLGSRSVMERGSGGHSGAELTLNIRSDQVLKARQIINSAKGRFV